MGDEPTIHEALREVREQVGVIPKGDKAPAKAGGFAYRGIDRIRVATALPMQGISVTETNIDKDVSTYTSSGGTKMRLVEVEITYEIFGPAGDSITTMGMGAASDPGSRADRQASIDAYKDMIETLLNIPPEIEDAEQNDEPAAQRESGDYETIPLDYVKGLLADTRELGIADEQVWKKFRGFARAMTLPVPQNWETIHTELREPLDQWVGEIEGAEDSAEGPPF